MQKPATPRVKWKMPKQASPGSNTDDESQSRKARTGGSFCKLVKSLRAPRNGKNPMKTGPNIDAMGKMVQG